MRIAIIDADLIGRRNHRFPNLAAMKLAGYHREHGDNVELITDYSLLFDAGGRPLYDHVYLSKVFTDTPVPAELLTNPAVSYGGTGFFMPTHLRWMKQSNTTCPITIFTTGGVRDRSAQA